MKKSKKIMLVPLMLGALVGTSACSLTDVNVNKESLDRIEASISEYMDKNNAYSSEYARDSLVSLLNEGMFNLTSKQYVNYELTEIIKAYDDLGNKAVASEWYCSEGSQGAPTMNNQCFNPYSNVKSYYDEATKTAKRYVSKRTYSTRDGEDLANTINEKYVFVKEDNISSYSRTIYNVANKKFEKDQVTRIDAFDWDYNWIGYDVLNVVPIKYYKIMYKNISSDSSFISYNKINDTSVEYMIYNSELDVTMKATFVNGMLEKYEQSDTTAFYGEPTDNAVVEVNIKYSCDDITVPDVETYTEVTN